MILGSQTTLLPKIRKHTRIGVSLYHPLKIMHSRFIYGNRMRGHEHASENGQKLINLKHFNCRIFREIRWKWNEIKSDEKKALSNELYDNKLLSQFLCAHEVYECNSSWSMSFKCPFNLNLSNQFDALPFYLGARASLTATLLLVFNH